MRNKLRLLNLVLIVVFIFSFTACTTPKTAATSTETTTASQTVAETTQPQNNPPVAIIVRKGDLIINQNLKFDGSTSYDKDNDFLSYEWNLPDGKKLNTESIEFMPLEYGDYEITLTVSDGKSTATYINKFTVRNLAPIAKASKSDIECKVDDIIEISAKNSYDLDGSQLTYSWQLPDGTTSQEESISYKVTEPGKQTIALTVSDGELNDTIYINIEATQSEEQFKKSCKNVKYGELLRNPTDYLTQPIHVKGEIVQYLSDMEFHFNITNKGYGFWDDRTWLILNNPPEENIIEGDVVEVWGLGGGNQEYETTSGAANTIPVIFAEYVKITQKAD
jgi:hypothetical protein